MPRILIYAADAGEIVLVEHRASQATAMSRAKDLASKWDGTIVAPKGPPPASQDITVYVDRYDD